MTREQRARAVALCRRRRDVASQGRGLWYESLEERRLLVVVASGADNDTAASLETYGGPGDPSLPGFGNVGRGSTTNSSVFYLGGGWALTANHVTIANPSEFISPGGVFFGTTQYLVDESSIHQLHDPITAGLADLKVFRIYGDPQLPAVLPGYLATSVPSGQVFMIGNGLTRGDPHSWNVNTSVVPWVWMETPPYNASGFDIVSPRRIRWGENEVYETNQYYNFGSNSIRYFSTQFGGTPLTHEAQASSGDSGGPVFYDDGSNWILSGIMITTTGYSGQPASTAVYGNTTWAADLSKYRDEILSIAGVVGRHAFYNNSVWDNNNEGIDANDDSAIATDKFAYFPGGGTAGPENATSYSRGINGIMVDLASNHGALSLDDFTFKMSPTHLAVNNTPSTWVDAPAPTGFSVRPGAGDGGSDRVEFVWDDGAIADRWLQVIVEGNDAAGGSNTNTGLAVSDIFYFGNKVADTFTYGQEGGFVVDNTDQILVRNNQGQPAFQTNIFDFNRDAIVDATDEVIARNNQGYMLAINISNPPAAPLPGSESADDGSPSAVASALASTSDLAEPVALAPQWIPPPAPALDVERASRERAFELWAGIGDDQWPSLEDDLTAGVSESLLVELAPALSLPRLL